MKVIFTKGLPASGKSTWAKKYVLKNKDWVRVCRDDLRNMRGQYWLPKQEKMITDMERDCVKSALSRGYNVIVDATNLNPVHFQGFIDFLTTYTLESGIKIDITSKSFDTSLDDCIKRDLIRPNSVGKDVIMMMWNKYCKKDISIIQDTALPKAIISDLDGTLCLHNGRSPFEYQKCDTDLVNERVFEILKQYSLTHEIIFLSGREDSCKDLTMQWLSKHSFNTNQLYMRTSGDFRKDYDIKLELFNANVKDKYHVDLVLDDRTQVVKLWRDLGLTCFQVAEGDF